MTWAAHTLTPGGMFGAKVVRGPLIVWAKGGGEGEDLPHLGLPQPSPLEVAAARLNMAPHLRAFVRAAHGKVRHSVRWRTPWKARARQAALWFIFGGLKELRLPITDTSAGRQEDVYTLPVQQALQEPAPCLWGTLPGAWVRRAFSQRFRSALRKVERGNVVVRARREWEKTHPRPQRPALRREEMQAMVDCLGRAQDAMAAGHLPTPEDLAGIARYTVREEGRRPCLLNVTWALRPCNAGTSPSIYRALWRYLRGCLFGASLRQALALRALERAAYRAYLTRRVKPVSRRTRAPRPLYARPRPPTAPLAPPLA